MEAEYVEAYRDLFERHWWWRARERLLLDELHRLQPVGGWGSILDVGCGDGLFFDKLLELGDVEGVEVDGNLVDPEGLYRGRIHVGPFDETFVPGRQFGLILMLDVLEHLRDPATALRHAANLLEPRGKILITVPAFNLLWTNHDDLNHHFVRFTRRSFHRVAEEAGLQIEICRYFFYWTFPAKLAIRVTEKFFRLEPRPAQVPREIVNSPLLLFSRAEERILGKLPMPFGSSLLVVIQKP